MLAQDRPVVTGDLGPRLDSVIRASALPFQGNVLIARRGETLLLHGYGLANRERSIAFSPATVVQIGSNTKDFTKTAIYQLIEQGRLSETDSLPRFFDGVPADKRGIQVRHLLEHTAGLPLALGADHEPLSREEWQKRLFDAQLASAPGAKREYSNAGYSVLAAIIERLSGEPYDAYIAEHIFQPAGLRETGLLLHQAHLDRVAHGYAGVADKGTMLDRPHDASGPLWNLRGNGGELSTLSDMQRFYRALLDNTLLQEERHRRAVFPTDRPIVLAGSDLTSFFIFANYPGAETQVFIASTSQEYPAPRLLKTLLPPLGIQEPTAEAGAVIMSPALKAIPETGVGRTVAAYFEAYNSRDTASMRRFFEEHAATGPAAPSLEERLRRSRQLWGDLGRLTVETVRVTSDGLAVSARSQNGDRVTLTFIVESEPPNRLRGIRVEVG